MDIGFMKGVQVLSMNSAAFNHCAIEVGQYSKDLKVYVFANHWSNYTGDRNRQPGPKVCQHGSTLTRYIILRRKFAIFTLVYPDGVPVHRVRLSTPLGFKTVSALTRCGPAEIKKTIAVIGSIGQHAPV
jgi:hypothetical protein